MEHLWDGEHKSRGLHQGGVTPVSFRLQILWGGPMSNTFSERKK